MGRFGQAYGAEADNILSSKSLAASLEILNLDSPACSTSGGVDVQPGTD
jgi:hypothetical protein